MGKIYILEDDKNISEIEQFALKNAGYEVSAFATASDFENALTKEHPGNTELYFRVTDDIDVNRMAVDLISRPVKLSVGRDLITYLKGAPRTGFRIN